MSFDFNSFNNLIEWHGKLKYGSVHIKDLIKSEYKREKFAVIVVTRIILYSTLKY
jgi:hypothetical protein